MVSEVVWGIALAVIIAAIVFFFVRSVIRSAKGECGCGCSSGSSGNCAGCGGRCETCREKK